MISGEDVSEHIDKAKTTYISDLDENSWVILGSESHCALRNFKLSWSSSFFSYRLEHFHEVVLQRFRLMPITPPLRDRFKFMSFLRHKLVAKYLSSCFEQSPGALERSC